MRFLVSTAPILLSALSLVQGHLVITAVQGANKVQGTGFAMDPKISRLGTSEQPFQLDTQVLKNLKDDPCGATLEGGSIDIAANIAAQTTAGSGSLPSINADGTVTMMIHQVNADGGGPVAVEVDTTGTGTNFKAVTVTQQIPGMNGLIRAGPNDAPLTVKLDSADACTGGSSGNVCLLRISNGGASSVASGAGPFGGCVAVQNNAAAGGAAAATTSGATSTKKNKQQGRAHARSFVIRDREAAFLAKREEEAAVLSKRIVVEEGREMIRRNLVELASRAIAKRALALTAGEIDDIKTATGTAIDIPIDALAGQVDANPLGGNSTTATGSKLTVQEAVNLKKAVQLAIESALLVLSNQAGTDGGADDEAATAKANEDARLAIEDGSLKSINVGNAGVGNPNFAAIKTLLGDLTLTNAAAVATPAVSGAGGAAAAASATASASSTGRNRKGGNNRNGNGNNGNGNGANRNGNGANRNGNNNNAVHRGGQQGRAFPQATPAPVI